MRRWRGLAGGAAAAGILVATGPAGALTFFGSPAFLESTGATAPRVAAGPDGTIAHLYGSDAGGPWRVRVQDPVGLFADAVEVSTAGATGGEVAVGPDGTTITAVTNGSTVEIARIGTDGALIGTVTSLARPALMVQDPHVVVDGAGRATVAWAEVAGLSTPITMVSVAPDGAVGTPVALTTAGNADDPRAAVAPDGRVTVVWARDEDTIEARRIGTDGTPEAQTLVLDDAPAEDDVDLPRVAFGPDGTATVVWSYYLGEDAEYDIRARRIDPAHTQASLGAPITVSQDNGDRPDVAVGPDGTATVVWQTDVGGLVLSTTSLRRVGPDGGLGPVVPLSGADERGLRPRVVARTDGSVVTAWVHFPPAADAVVRVLRVAPDGTADAPLTLSEGGVFGSAESGVEVATAPSGRTAFGWSRIVEGESGVETVASASEFFPAMSPPGLTAVPGDGALTISWQPPPDPGLPVIGYLVTLDSGAPGCATVATTCTVTGLPNGVTQIVRVRAVTALGAGAPTSILATPEAPPAAPPDPGTPPAMPGGTPPPGGGQPIADPPALGLTGVRVTPASVVRRTPVRRTAPVRVALIINRAALVRIGVERRLPGVRRRGACVAPTRALRRAGARPCVRFVPVAAVRRALPPGPATVVIRGLRVGAHTLAPGRYRVSVRASADGFVTPAIARPLTVLRPAVRRVRG